MQLECKQSFTSFPKFFRFNNFDISDKKFVKMKEVLACHSPFWSMAKLAGLSSVMGETWNREDGEVC